MCMGLPAPIANSGGLEVCVLVHNNNDTDCMACWLSPDSLVEQGGGIDVPASYRHGTGMIPA